MLSSINSWRPLQAIVNKGEWPLNRHYFTVKSFSVFRSSWSWRRWLPKFNQQFFLDQKYIRCKIFIEIRSV